MTVIRRVPGGHEVRKRERTRKPTRGRHLQQWRPDSRLKSVLRGNLHSAGVARKCATISHNGGRIHDANIAVIVTIGARLIVVHGVGEVLNLQTEFQLLAFGNAGLLSNRHAKTADSSQPEIVSSDIAELTRTGR